jgi:hypothetical protein
MLKDDHHRVVEGAWSALNKIHDKDFDRSYATWRDWYEDEQKVHYTCLEHKEISESAPGVCPKCGKRLERMSRDGVRKPEAPVARPGSSPARSTRRSSRRPPRSAAAGCGKDWSRRNPSP